MKQISRILFCILISGVIFSCQEEDDAFYKPDVVEESTDPIAIYFRENFLNTYGTAVRWFWSDKNVDDSKRVTPAYRDVCIPMGKFILNYWIAPFEITPDGKTFMQEHFPPEIVFIGSPMYNSDGRTITLGYADAGARITFTQVNEYDLTNENWVLLQLRTAQHEFGHIIHQKHNLPNGYKEVNPENYRSNNWVNLPGDVQQNNPRVSREAISLGMVSNYGTADVQEDFCELLSIYITSDENEFNERYIIHEPENPYPQLDESGNPVLDESGKPIMIDPAEDAADMNAGRDLIAIKLKLIKDYYMDLFNIDLDKVRDETMRVINEALTQE